MPRLKADENRDFRAAVTGAAVISFGGISGLADRMGMARQTLSGRLREPERLTVAELRELRQKLNIPKEQFLAAVGKMI